jgi:hypothetical protein
VKETTTATSKPVTGLGRRRRRRARRKKRRKGKLSIY